MEDNAPKQRPTSPNKLRNSKSVQLKHIQALANKKPQGRLPRADDYILLVSAMEAILKDLVQENHQDATKITDQLQTELLKPGIRQLIQKLSHDKQKLAKIQKQQKDVQNLTISIEELQRKKQDIENQFESIQLILNEQIQNACRQNQELREKLKIQEANQSYYDARQKVDLVKREQLQIQGRIVSMKREQAGLESLRNEFAAMSQKMESLRKQQMNAAEKQKALSQNASLRQNLSSKQRQLEQMQRQLRQKQNVISDLKQKSENNPIFQMFKLKQKELKQSQRTISSLRMKVQKYENQNHNQSQILNDLLNNNIEDTNNQKNARVQRQLNSQKERNKQLQKNLESVTRMYEQCFQDRNLLADQKQMMEARLKKFQQEAEKSSQTQARNLESTVSRLRDELENEFTTIARLKEKAEETQQKMAAKIQSLQRECTSLKDECDRLQKARLEDVERQRNLSMEQIAVLNKELNEERRQHLGRFKEHEKEQKRTRHLEIRLQQLESSLKRGGSGLEAAEVTYEEVIVYLKDFCDHLRGDTRRRFKGKLSEIART